MECTLFDKGEYFYEALCGYIDAENRAASLNTCIQSIICIIGYKKIIMILLCNGIQQ